MSSAIWITRALTFQAPIIGRRGQNSILHANSHKAHYGTKKYNRGFSHSRLCAAVGGQQLAVGRMRLHPTSDGNKPSIAAFVQERDITGEDNGS